MSRVQIWKQILASKRLLAAEKLKREMETSTNYWVNLRQFKQQEQRQLTNDMDEMQLMMAELKLKEDKSDESL